MVRFLRVPVRRPLGRRLLESEVLLLALPLLDSEKLLFLMSLSLLGWHARLRNGLALSSLDLCRRLLLLLRFSCSLTPDPRLDVLRERGAEPERDLDLETDLDWLDLLLCSASEMLSPPTVDCDRRPLYE